MAPGDLLFLTKPLGLGIISTAIKRQMATEEQRSSAVQTMAMLNAPAAEAMMEAGPSAATDITGFGLLGHLQIALTASGASARIDGGAVPLLSGTLELADRGVIPAGTRKNHAFVAPNVDWGPLTVAEQLVLADAQTSGGLLISVREERSSLLRDALERRGIAHAEVGHVLPGPPGRIDVGGRLRR
jgi:selenide,water dikinase